MSDDSFSLDALRRFLRQSPMQGLINPAAARSRLNALDQLEQELTGDERRDVRRIEVDELVSRFHKLEGESIRPEALDVYAGRLRMALTDFLAWMKDPESFTSVGQEKARALPRKPGKAGPGTSDHEAAERILLRATDNPINVVPVPVRPDNTVYLANMPLDLTVDEAERIARVVRAYARPAEDEEEGES
ncbi:MAG: hypothetical protein ACOCSR_03435 [Wenzhouxiangella sp.]